jgi:hypothetical protein
VCPVFCVNDLDFVLGFVVGFGFVVALGFPVVVRFPPEVRQPVKTLFAVR